MMFSLIVVIASIIALFVVLFLIKDYYASVRDLGQLATQLRSVDVDAFRNLMDEREHQYLREHLPSAEFRVVHRERMLAAAEYVRCAAHNAGILIRLAEAARSSEDNDIAATAERLLQNAIRLRLYALHAIPRLYICALIPGAHLGQGLVPETYGNLTRQLIMLGCLHYPAQEVASAL